MKRYNYPPYEHHQPSGEELEILDLHPPVSLVWERAQVIGIKVELVKTFFSKKKRHTFIKTALYLNDVLCRIHAPSFQGYPKRFASLLVVLNRADPRIEVFVVVVEAEESKDGYWFYLIPRCALKRDRVYIPFRTSYSGFSQNILKRFRGDWSIVGAR
ncbi:MAG: hypothetical protein Q8Q94_04525 [bacterium]|nr:hypothetical protein [bacterium]MDZ4299623.1 hypothetical protein [Candidatus Sungbacteria bacterium]